MTRAAAASEFTAELRQQQFGALLKLSPQAIAVLDSDGRIREWNPAAVALLGWPREEVLGRRLQTLAPAPHRTELKRLWTELRASRQTGAVVSSHLRRDGGGGSVEVYMAPIQDVDGSFAGVVATLSGQGPSDHGMARRSTDAPGPNGSGRWRDGPALTALERDDVTGLPGRRWLQQQLTAPVPEGQVRAVALLDVDAFALVNQGYGPEAGDDVLRGLAERLAKVSGIGSLGRWQADEFVLIVDAVDAGAELQGLVDRMAPVAREPFQVAEDLVRLTLSAGLVTTGDVPPPLLFRSASAAMAAAKARGRDCAVWFDEATTPAVGGSGLRMANDLHRGLDEGEMRLHFQPIVELATNDVDGVEALIRWERPGVGLLAPGAFIELAERTGQIVALGEWVIEEACRAAVEFAAVAPSPLRVSINVSARQLSDPGLVSMLEDALTRTGCEPANIAVEVTETALLHDMSAATAILEGIKSLGVELHLDDFGTGYSSLLYLRHFPVDRIKIDGSFVGGLGTSVADTAIVASTIALAHSVGLVAIAEGVETTQQLTLLRQMGCDFAQGYLLSHPLPADELLTWLQQQLPSRLVPRPREPERHDVAGQDRDHAGDERDDVADQRDLLADQRDELADRRDDAASAHLRELGQSAASVDTAAMQQVLHQSAVARHEAAADRSLASHDRVVGADDRLQAERDRDVALVDRDAGADERDQARQDRTQALADRQTSAQDRQRSSLDALTGAYLRDAGLVALMAEMAAALRHGEPLTLAYIAIEPEADTGPSAGQMTADALTVLVANAIGACLRPHDLLVRGGPQHFLCALPGLTPTAAAELLAGVNVALAGPPRLVAVTVGYAELLPQESTEQLIGRASAARHSPA